MENDKVQNLTTSEKPAGAAIADEDVKPVRYWLYSPGTSSVYWDEFCNSGIMAIGWDEIGNLRDYKTKEAMRQRMKETIDPSNSFTRSA